MNCFLKKFFNLLLVLTAFLIFSPDVRGENTADESPSETCRPQGKGGDRKCHKDKKEMIKEIREFKVEFLAKEMELTAAQKKKFAEVYAERMDELHTYMEKSHALEKRMESDKNLSEEEYAKAIATLDEYRDKCREIEKRNDAKLKTFLSQKQMFRMREAERKFRDTMRKMRHSPKKK